MSDATVAESLRSASRLVVVEAPAGCGKTHQAAEYAASIAPVIAPGRVLILAHTHAACDTFAARTPAQRSHVDIRTIDSLVVAIASAYPASVHISGDISAWARREPDGYSKLAAKVIKLLCKSPGIARMLARRYPVVICDEHQDASVHQHAIVMALCAAGAYVRIFGDPMQALFDDGMGGNDDSTGRWKALIAGAAHRDELDVPHRWATAPELGSFILTARQALRDGRAVDFSSHPPMVSVVIADNESPAWDRYRVSNSRRQPIDSACASEESMFILSAHTSTVHALRSFFNRRFPVWEGHVRKALEKLAEAIERDANDAVKITQATLRFTDTLCTGFSASAYGNDLLFEVARGCTPPRRGKARTLQTLGELILSEPNHRGVSSFLRRLAWERKVNPAFKSVKIDYPNEFWDACSLGSFADLADAISEIARRRTVKRTGPPHQAISTIHKAKGLERREVIIIPCDARHFPDTPKGRRLLYVALSRPTTQLTLVVSPSSPSPLIEL